MSTADKVRRRVYAFAVASLLAPLGCSAPEPAAAPAPTRGYVLISLDTLGARHLGAYGATRDNSPFFDRLAERGTLFENAFVQYPSTLVSHASIFTGLYPREHGVRLPGQRLSPELETIPERFRANGFVTAGFTEGGFVSADHGFDRGFDEFEERTAFSPDDEIERTFRRGLDFLSARDPSDRFFLFLHTYSVHDPYEPPEPYRSSYLASSSDEIDSSGRFLREVYMGRATVSDDDVGRLRALYDGSVRYVDSVLESFFGELEEMGIDDEVTVVVTSDHGEEFLQHGVLGHHQIYPEVLRVPLLVVHPGVSRGARIATPVASIDLGPTLFELAGLPRVDLGSGQSLAPAIGGRAAAPEREIFAEVFDQDSQLAVILGREEGVFQYLTSKRVGEPDGTWIARMAVFDLDPGATLELVSFAERRTVRVTVDGEPRGAVEVGGEWTPLELQEATVTRRVGLATDGCSVPLYLGVGKDSRCLSVKVRGAPLERHELLDLADPDGRLVDADSAEAFAIERDLARRLSTRRWTLRAPPVSGAPSAESVEVLRALGYID